MSNRVEERFAAVASEYTDSLVRLAHGFERDPDKQRDLVQEMLVALWRALPSFEERSSLRTWVYRVAHNVAVSHVVRSSRDRLARSVSLEEIADGTATRDALGELEGRDTLARLSALIRALRPLDAQIVVLHLEGLDPPDIAEITGLTAGNVAVKVHRIKAALRRALDQEGGAQ